MTIVWTGELVIALRQARLSGTSIEQCADHLGMSKGPVEKKCRELEINGPRPNRATKDGDRFWSDEEIVKLRELVMSDPRISTAEMGRKLERSKHSIVGKKRRLDLPKRASPIVRSA